MIQGFPEKSVRTCYVNMSQVGDHNKYKIDKQQNPDIITTPLHLACKVSNDEGVRQLIDLHNYDVNILLNEKSAIFDLLSTSCYLDFNILNFIFKKTKPNINRGNPFIIKSLIEFGKPHPYARDLNGKAAIHIAASKLDVDTFD